MLSFNVRFSCFFWLVVFVYTEVLGQKSGKNNLPSDGRNCATEYVDRVHKQLYGMPSSEIEERILKRWIAEYLQENKRKRQSDDTLMIPCVVHVVHNGEPVGTGTNISQEQIDSQFEVLNEDFNKIFGTNGYNSVPVGASMRIKFVKATHDPSGRKMLVPGVDRYLGERAGWTISEIESELKPRTIWDPKKYLNIWTVKFSGSNSSTLGYAQLPNFSTLNGLNNIEGLASTDGVVIRYNVFGRTTNLNPPYNLGRTLTHEMGHFFGLRHIWGDQGNCTGTDYCDDTPPTEKAIYGCPSTAASCIAGVDAMYQNYMDYTDDRCMNVFTNDQKNRVLTVLQKSPRRKELPASGGFVPSSVPSANFSTISTFVCTGTPVNITNRTTNNPTAQLWTIYNEANQTVASATSYDLNYTFTAPGLYSVRLIASNSFGSDTIFRRRYLAVSTQSPQTMPYTDTFESITSSSGQWLFYAPMGSSLWHVYQGASAYGLGSQSIRYNNYDTTFDQTGKESVLLSPRFHVGPSTLAYLSFDVAYSFYTSTGSFPESYYDTLSVFYTTNCGASKTLIYKRGGANLATAPPRDVSFVPSANQWRTEQISLPFLYNMSGVQFFIQNKSGWGNNLYIDNFKVQIGAPATVPASNFVASPVAACPGQVVSFSDQSLHFPTAWNWSVIHGEGKSATITTTTQNPSVMFNVPGTYHVQLTASNGMGVGNTLLKSNYVRIFDNPVVGLKARVQSQISNCSKIVNFTASGAAYYEWYRSVDTRRPELLYTAVQPLFSDTVSAYTVYSVVGIDTNGCRQSASVVIDHDENACSIARQTDKSTHNFTVFPNPSDGWLHVKTHEEGNFRIFDLHGTEVWSAFITGNLLQKKLGLSPGVYFYHFNSYRGRFVIY